MESLNDLGQIMYLSVLPWKQKQCEVQQQHSSCQQARASCKVHPDTKELENNHA